MAKIGFVGLGNMGAPMGRNLLEAGHELRVYDIAPAASAAQHGRRQRLWPRTSTR